MNKGMICFDMDGTIADLYGVENWLSYLEHESPFPYITAKPMWDMDKLASILNQLINQGWEIRIISWLSKDSSKEFDEKVREAKKFWLRQYHFPYHRAHLVKYGTTKANCIRSYNRFPAILVDDNKKVREGWSMGGLIDPTTENLIERLSDLLE